jgi:hypothetical protein
MRAAVRGLKVTGVTFVRGMRDVVGKPRKLLAGRRRGDGSGVV